MKPEPLTTAVVVSTEDQTQGTLHELRLSSVEGEPLRLQPSPTLPGQDAAYRQQLDRVSDALRTIVPLPGFAALALRDRATSALQLDLSPTCALRGASHGLAMLATALGHVLGIQVRRDRILSAAINRYDPQTRRIELSSVLHIDAKAKAAGHNNVTRLFYHWRLDDYQAEAAGEKRNAEDGLMRQFRLQQAQYRGDVDYQCRAVPLPRYINVINLINLLFESRSLVGRIRSVDDQNHSLLTELVRGCLWNSVEAPSCPEEYPDGLGEAIAMCRAQGFCPADLPERIHLPFLAAELPESRLTDIVKLAFSERPHEPLEEDLKVASQGGNQAEDCNFASMPPARFMTLLDLGVSQGWIEPGDQAVKLQGLLVQTLTQLEHLGLPPEFYGYLAEAAIRCRVRHPRVLEAIGNILNRCAQRSGSHEQRQALEQLRVRVTRRQLMPRMIVRRPQEGLTMTFSQPTSEGNKPAYGPDHHAVVEPINSLQVTYSSGHGLRLTLPSPVLLLENCRAMGTYALRRRFRGNDDTFTRLPHVEMSIIHQLFGDGTRIEFLLRRPEQLQQEPVGVFWMSDQIPFPPAIDSQFLAAALERWGATLGTEREAVRSVIDVGCGTGYLAAVAAYLFPSIHRVVLSDLDSVTVLGAADNLQCSVRRHGNGHFPRFEPVTSADIELISGDYTKIALKDACTLLVANPPYLPEKELAGTGMDRATNGTQLLEAIVRRAGLDSKYVVMVFSTLAWREFEEALVESKPRLRRIAVLDRQLVPFRLPHIQPWHPSEHPEYPDSSRAEQDFNQRVDYFKMLMQPGRDLIDLDDEKWQKRLDSYIRRVKPVLSTVLGGHELEDHSAFADSRTHKAVLETLIHKDSRGFRFWHETRVVLLEALPDDRRSAGEVGRSHAQRV